MCIRDSAKTARGGKGLKQHAVDIDRLQPFHRSNRFQNAFFDDFAIVQILVDHALGRPVERITQMSGGVLRQGPDAQTDRAHFLKLVGKISRNDADETRSKAALRGHHPF